MAVSVAIVKRLVNEPPSHGERNTLVEITGDTSYPTGGSTITPANCGMTEIKRMIVANPYPFVDREYVWDHANSKLIGRVISTALEITAATNCSADKIVAHVFGR